MGLVIFGIFLAIGKWYPGSGADVLDWKPTRSYEDEIRADVDAKQREQQQRAAEFRRSSGSDT